MDDKEKLIRTMAVSRVFRPGAPIDKIDLFAGRKSQLHDVITATMQPGRHVILFGERGVGKTSLARVLSEVLAGAEVKLLDCGTLNCDATDDFSSLWHKIFRELSVVLERKRAGFTPAEEVPGLFRVSLESFLPDHAKPDDIRHALAQLSEPALIVIDEVDRLNKAATVLMADTIKNLSDHSVPTTIVLVGVADSVEGLIAEHKSIERALVQVHMPRMSKLDLIQVLDKGVAVLGMTIKDDAKEWIADLSKGLPFYTHSLGLYAAIAAIEDSRIDINFHDVGQATRATVQKSHTILAAYNKATASPQKHSLHDEVLLACALVERDELGWFSPSAVSKPLSSIMGKTYETHNFTRHLQEFSGDKRGKILQKTGHTRRQRYRFHDAMMEPFVIVRGWAVNLLTQEISKKLTRS